MTRDLDLPGGTTLTSADSNVSSNYTLPASSTSGFSSDTTAYVYNSGSTTCASGQPCYSYYSYVAATAGTNPSSGEATSDICPKGWRLPTGGSGGEFQTLYKNASYNTYAKMRAPIASGGAAFALAGYFTSSTSTPAGQGRYGYYWSSTWHTGTQMNFLYLDTSYASPTNYYGRDGGPSIRCVLKDK